MHVDFGDNRFLFLIRHAINWVVKIKSPFYQGIESASSPGLYSLDVQYFRRTVFPRELGPGGGGPYSLREYGPPDPKSGRTIYPMTPEPPKEKRIARELSVRYFVLSWLSCTLNYGLLLQIYSLPSIAL